MDPKVDMRKHPRLGPLIIKAEFESEGLGAEGYLTNLSEGGAFLATEELPRVGAIVSLRIDLPWRLGQMTAQARVVWRTDAPEHRAKGHPAGAGVSFTLLSPDAQSKLRLYMQRFHELAARIEDRA